MTQIVAARYESRTDPRRTHTVYENESGVVVLCTCEGWGHHRKCWHVEEQRVLKIEALEQRLKYVRRESRRNRPIKKEKKRAMDRKIRNLQVKGSRSGMRVSPKSSPKSKRGNSRTKRG